MLTGVSEAVMTLGVVCWLENLVYVVDESGLVFTGDSADLPVIQTQHSHGDILMLL
jgi:hypothetical protein